MEFRGGVNWRKILGLGEPKPKRGPREKSRDEFVKWVIQFADLQWDLEKLKSPNPAVQEKLTETVMKLIWGDALEREKTFTEEEIREMAEKIVAHYKKHPPSPGKK